MEVKAYSKNGNVVGQATVVTVEGSTKCWGNGYVQVSDFIPLNNTKKV